MPWNECCRISILGTQHILSLLDEFPIKATFFATWTFAKECPDLIGRLLAQGHELACHGLDHADRYGQMPDSQAIDALGTAKDQLENRFACSIKGFRAPRMQGPKPAVLASAGFLYDSSLHPTWVPGLYNSFATARTPSFHSNVWKVPASVTPLLRLPVSWVWARNFGLTYQKLCSSWVMRTTPYLSPYFHPVDFVEVDSGVQNSWRNQLIFRRSGKAFLNQMQHFLGWCREKGFQAETIQSYVFHSLIQEQSAPESHSDSETG